MNSKLNIVEPEIELMSGEASLVNHRVDELTRNFASQLEKHGIMHFSYTLLHGDGSSQFYFNDKKWGKRMIDDECHKEDALVQYCLSKNSSFVPWDLLAMNKQQKEIFDERQNVHKKYNGVAVSLIKTDTPLMFALSTDSKVFDLPHYLAKHKDVIRDSVDFIKGIHRDQRVKKLLSSAFLEEDGFVPEKSGILH
ncbi:MAG: hypothetical protein HON43_02505 [Alphaproteobacteria bacterium]|nr:hypothetical protein [Alphaproteobacteria bacterium]MBT5390444.1 hypothetical protein [Alphaproteobacteria bacterium]MBT5540241.1 hypothetical protein [Alphaproteobacteria bacterium]